MWRDAQLIFAKDLRIELRSRVLTTQLLPFGLIVLVLFGFGVSPDLAVRGPEGRTVLSQVTPGLFWMAVTFMALWTLNRAFAVESTDGALDGLRMAGAEPAGVFVGKAAAVAVELFVVEVVLAIGAAILFGAPLAEPALGVVTLALTTLAVATSGTLYGAVAAGTRLRETLVPLMVLPAVAPVLLAASRATEAALFGPAVDGWRWLPIIGLFALLYGAVGIMSFGALMEET